MVIAILSDPNGKQDRIELVFDIVHPIWENFHFHIGYNCYLFQNRWLLHEFP